MTDISADTLHSMYVHLPVSMTAMMTSLMYDGLSLFTFRSARRCGGGP